MTRTALILLVAIGLTAWDATPHSCTASCRDVPSV